MLNTKSESLLMATSHQSVHPFKDVHVATYPHQSQSDNDEVDDVYDDEFLHSYSFLLWVQGFFFLLEFFLQFIHLLLFLILEDFECILEHLEV